VAYYFDADRKDVLEDVEAYGKLVKQMTAWNDLWKPYAPPPSLTFEDLPDGGMKLVDTRQPMRQVIMELDPAEAAVYRAIDDPAAVKRICRVLGREAGIGKKEVKSFLEQFVSVGIAVAEGGKHLGLATEESTCG
jgi:hypothetical protein